MTTADILKKEFDSIKEDLIKRHDQLGMRASGQWADSLEQDYSFSKGTYSVFLLGEKYTEQLAFGRKPGKFPPIKAIEQWIVNKGIKTVEANISVSSLAFLIARKIAREGTKYFQQGGTDLVDSVVTPQRIQDILDKVQEVNVSFFVSGLIQQIKAIPNGIQ